MAVERQRTFTRVLTLFLFRTAIFSCVHVVFYFIRLPKELHNGTGEWAMSDIIALSSCCWLALTLDLGIIEILRYVWKLRRQKSTKENVLENNGYCGGGGCVDNSGDSVKNKKKQKRSCSILLIPQTDWYTLRSSVLLTENIEVKVNGNNNTKKTHKNEILKKNAVELVVTPWTLWYYVYAAGIGLFVMGFSFNGLSLISESSFLLSSIIAISFIFQDETEATFPLQYLASWGMGLSVGLVVISNVIGDPYIWGWKFLENVWMAVVLPIMSSIFLCKCSRQARAMNLTPEKILMFAMPSMAVMSAAFLSLYISVNQQRSFYIQLQNLFEEVINNSSKTNSSIIFKLSESLGYTQLQTEYNNDNITGYNQQSPNYGSLFSWANSTQMEGVKTFVNAGKGLDMLLEKGNALSIISVLLAPFMLWVAMVTVMGSVIRGVFNAQSAFSSYVLVLAVKHFLLNGGAPWNIAALVIVVPSCIMTIVAETWKHSSFYTHEHFTKDFNNDHNNGDLDDDEDADEEDDDAVNTASV
jgi:hypothetical protein